MIEAITYRWLGHVDWREDLDVGINRCKKTLDLWKNKCPLKRLKNSILKENILSIKNLNDIDDSIQKEIKICWEEALEASYPRKDSLLNNVYS